MCCSYLTNTIFRRSFTLIYCHKWTQIIGPTWCKSQDCWNPVQPAAIHARIKSVLNMQVGCYAFHVDLKLTIYSSGLPTSVCYHFPQDLPLLSWSLSLHFHTSTSSLQTPQHGVGELESHRKPGASSNPPPAGTQLQCRHLFVDRDSANAATKNMNLEAQLKILRKAVSSRDWKQHVIGCEYSWIGADGHRQAVWCAAGYLQSCVTNS